MVGFRGGTKPLASVAFKRCETRLKLGPRAYPHRLGARTAVLRNGALYRVVVPLDAITRVSARSERIVGSALSERDGTVLLPARRRVDVWLELDRPARVQRPFRESLLTRRLAVASDHPDALVAALQSGRTASRSGVGEGLGTSALGLLAALDIAGVIRDAAAPG